MKKYYILILCFIAFIINNATAQVGYAPEVGVNFSNMKYAPPSPFQQASTKGLIGPRIGGIADLDLGAHIYLQPGIFFSSMGAKRNYSYNYHDTSEAINETLRLNYIQVPINVLYKTGHQGDNRFFFGAGVYFAELVGGKDQANDIVDSGTGHTYPVNITFSPRNNSVASFDLGVNVMLGYEMSTGGYIRAFYSLGVRDLSLDSDYGETDKNYAGGVSIGYFFGKNRHQKRVVAPIEEGN